MNPATRAWELSFFPSRGEDSPQADRVVLVDDEQEAASQFATSDIDTQCDCDCDC